MPFKMNWMDTRPLSHCSFLDFRFSAKSAKSDCPVFFASKIILFMHNKYLLVSLKGVLNMHRKDCMMKLCRFRRMRCRVMTSNCYNNKTIEPVLMMFTSF